MQTHFKGSSGSKSSSGKSSSKPSKPHISGHNGIGHTGHGHGGGSAAGVLAGIIMAALIGFVLCCLVCFFAMRWRRRAVTGTRVRLQNDICRARAANQMKPGMTMSQLQQISDASTLHRAKVNNVDKADTASVVQIPVATCLKHVV